MDKEIYCCEEHVEIALDVVVNECETFPNIELLKQEKLSTATCEYCGKLPVYIVSN
ncbi:CxxH/CxxC protein [Bacillus kwashiorkori]|uniref:CxxH/CxxC protein n=1 Tax=Bacillus kwashiorkori TaxID=1522318 RepID=UPI0008F865F2|nr:CxxH/CxxC protein [Bacillus kwashiorkori]